MTEYRRSGSEESCKEFDSAKREQEEAGKDDQEDTEACRFAVLIANALEHRLSRRLSSNLREALADFHHGPRAKAKRKKDRSHSHTEEHSDRPSDRPPDWHSDPPSDRQKSASKGSSGFDRILYVPPNSIEAFRDDSDVHSSAGDKVHQYSDREQKVTSVGDLEKILASQLLDQESLGADLQKQITPDTRFVRQVLAGARPFPPRSGKLGARRLSTLTGSLRSNVTEHQPSDGSAGNSNLSDVIPVVSLPSQRSTASFVSRASGIEQIRAERAKDLTSQVEDLRREVLHRKLFPVLRICGLLPWDLGTTDKRSNWVHIYLWYQRTIVFIVFAAASLTVANCVQVTVGGSQGGIEDSSLAGFGLWSDVPVALGSFMGLLLLGVFWGSPDLVQCNAVVLSYMRREGFLDEWKKRQRKEAGITSFFWLLIVSIRVGTYITNAARKDGLEVLYLLAVLVSQTMTAALVYCSMYVCNALTGLLDVFAKSVMLQDHIINAIHEWNVLQAVLRICSSATQWCVFSLQATAVTSMLLVTNDMARGEENPILIVPVVVASLNILRTLFRAAEVTDKCVRLPSLINSFSRGVAMDDERQYVVEYMINSAAGFYVFDVRITAGLALKSFYVSCLAVFALSSRFA